MPAYTMNGRNYMPQDSTQKPGPGAHSPEKVGLHEPISHGEYWIELKLKASCKLSRELAYGWLILNFELRFYSASSSKCNSPYSYFSLGTGLELAWDRGSYH